MDRRLFLALTGVLLATPLSMRGPAPLRRVRLFNAHTRESFDGPYRDENGPIETAMEDLSVLLRDHHSGERTAIDVGVIDFLAEIIDAVGVSRAIVLSAYRSISTNQALASTTFGVAENSQHLYGRALDIHLDTRLEQAMEAARAMKRGGVGWYPHARFMHIDTGPVRNWTLDGKDLDHLLSPSSVQPMASARHSRKMARNTGQLTSRDVLSTRTTSPHEEQQSLKMRRLIADLVSRKIE
jgi:uncharacterized protein YcbK (DUF882 family)